MVSIEQGRQRAPVKELSERYRTIDGHNLRHAVRAGLAWLRTHQQIVNSLNVFPVPDGDTGTNMLLTMQAAWDEIEKRASSSASEVAEAIAQGALMGARGNSGVILSQLWRGFARALDGKERIDSETIARALAEARDTAYKGVVRPVEGTILTVSKAAAAAAELAQANGSITIVDMLEQVVEAADEAVERTPEQLPVLKEAGVVDSGGKGLYYILEGMLRSVYRLPLDEPTQEPIPLASLNLDGVSDSIEPGQDWEVIIDFRPDGDLDLEGFYARLEELGTSIQVGEGEGMFRMHIHVPDDTQYEPIEYVRGLGTITKIAIENLMDQVEAEQSTASDLILQNISADQIAVVVVAPGPGIANVFASLGAAAIIEGGQTMNPSTEEILNAFENLPTDKIIILPNNKNIQLAAKQACELTVKQARVIPSLSVPQGVGAMLSYDRDGGLDEVTASMTAELDDIAYGELTRATRTVEIDGVKVHEGEEIGLLNGRLVVCEGDLESSLMELLETGGADDAEIISLYQGKDVSGQQANTLADGVRERWPSAEIELINGGQPHYHFIVSIE
ncbi:MAG: DAK2 domain-containing protein [Anaerolineales bacterium]